MCFTLVAFISGDAAAKTEAYAPSDGRRKYSLRKKREIGPRIGMLFVGLLWYLSVLTHPGWTARTVTGVSVCEDAKTFCSCLT